MVPVPIPAESVTVLSAQMPALWTAAAAVALCLLAASPGARRAAAAAARFLAALAALAADRAGMAPRPPFPRGAADLLRDPRALFDALRRGGAVPAAAALLSVERLGDVEAEPDKASTTASLRFVYSSPTPPSRPTTPSSSTTTSATSPSSTPPTSTSSVDVFAKFQSGRGMPLWLQAVRAAVEPGVAREVDFYAQTRDACGLRTARVLLAEKRTWVNRVCIALEHLPLRVDDGDASKAALPTDPHFLRVVPDHQFRSVEDLCLMVKKVAAMHAIFWGKAGAHPASAWLPRRRGIEFAGWALSLAPPRAKQAPFFEPIFRGIDAYFADRALTVVHGDCRPGNMIFEGSPAAQDVIFSDFEAVNVAPGIWDVTYATVLGLTPALRRAHQLNVLKAYRQALEREVTKRDAEVSLPTQVEMEDQMLLLTLVLFYVSYTVTTAGFWKKQGNTNSDMRSWGARVLTSLLDADPERVGRLIGIDAAAFQSLKAFAEDWAQNTKV